MVTVAAAEQIIMAQAHDYGNEPMAFDRATGRTLATAITADRDLPPCNRVTMDGIAVRYADIERGLNDFEIKGTIAAGNVPIAITDGTCAEIMTGAALPDTADTVIRYEDVTIEDGVAHVAAMPIRKGQNIHTKGKDKKQGDIVARAGQVVDATIVSMAASVGCATIHVRKLPRVMIISTGDELVPATAVPTAYQVRSSNNHTIKAVLQRYCIQAELLHLPDEPEITRAQLAKCLDNYDVIIMSGGVSMGKFDYVPRVLEALQVTMLFHKVQQRPGKPFWFGKHNGGTLVFAFPGNPVSTFMCLHRYLLPWLEACLAVPGSTSQQSNNLCAILDADVTFAPALQYFVQVSLRVNEQGELRATPMEGNGSGDFANLLDTQAFMELPLEESNFKRGTIYRIWPFKQVI